MFCQRSRNLFRPLATIRLLAQPNCSFFNAFEPLKIIQARLYTDQVQPLKKLDFEELSEQKTLKYDQDTYNFGLYQIDQTKLIMLNKVFPSEKEEKIYLTIPLSAKLLEKVREALKAVKRSGIMSANYDERFEIKEVECRLSIETLITSKRRVLNIRIGAIDGSKSNGFYLPLEALSQFHETLVAILFEYTKLPEHMKTDMPKPIPNKTAILKPEIDFKWKKLSLENPIVAGSFLVTAVFMICFAMGYVLFSMIQHARGKKTVVTNDDDVD